MGLYLCIAQLALEERSKNVSILFENVYVSYACIVVSSNCCDEMHGKSPNDSIYGLTLCA